MKKETKGNAGLNLYVNQEAIHSDLKDLGLSFLQKPGDIKERKTLAVVVQYLGENGRKDYSDVMNVIADCTDKTHIPVIVLDDRYNPAHAAEVWLKKNVVRYLPLDDDPATLEEVKRFLAERLRQRGREAELTESEILKVGWSVKIERDWDEQANLVSLFVGSMGRFMVELKTLLDIIRPEAEGRMKDKGALTPKKFKELNLAKVMEFQQAVNAGKETLEFEGKNWSLGEIKDELTKSGANVLFTSPPKGFRNHIIIEGETGSGKTLIARFIHDYVYRGIDSGDCGKLVKVNCANLGEKIMETQLFGSMQGAYTGAITRPGAILDAYHGTVFLDEIGELTAELQARLLSYLDTQTLQPDGWYGKLIYVPSLVVAATNRHLADEVATSKFRRDLHHRLGFTVTIPPLRNRLADLERLVDFVLQNPMVNPWWDEKKKDRLVTAISRNALEILRHHPFPGNFRELEQILRQACVTVQTQGLRVITEDTLRLQGLKGDYCP
jgi:hypothetical protein